MVLVLPHPVPCLHWYRRPEAHPLDLGIVAALAELYSGTVVSESPPARPTGQATGAGPNRSGCGIP